MNKETAGGASETTHVFHKNREISYLAMKKKHSKVNTSSRSHRKFQTRKDKTNKKPKKKKKKRNSGMNNSASLTPVQGPSTVVCMIMTYL
jgi:hypothetical protein